MRPFQHLNSQSLDATVSLLAEYDGRASVIAGGTDLLGTLKDNIHPVYPEALVNIKTIPRLAYVREDAQGLRIGSLTRLQDIVASVVVEERYGVLGEAARVVGSPQIRRMGTIGGNICQEPRCWYYRHPDNMFYCTRKDGTYCNALTGENQYHSIFGAARVRETPCSAACPAGVDIPTYVSMIRAGDVSGAATLLVESNPIPAVTGRVCPHFCEQTCNRGEFDEAVSVRGIERFLGDYILEHASDILKPPHTHTQKRVAVVGCGPAGLSAAYYLRRMGHGVTVFDRMSAPGGMLAYAIPAYRLPRDVVRRAAKAIEDTGVRFRLEVDVGKDVTVEDLRKDFDSVFLAAGAWAQPSLGIEGEEFTKWGLQFLTDLDLGVKQVPDRRVAVIGGGSAAVDVGITALRLGAKEVTLACLERRDEMPALEEEIEQALEEGIKLMPSWGPAKVVNEHRRVIGVELVRCASVFDENACFAPSFDETITKTVEADLILMAVGQRTDLSFLGPGSPLAAGGGLVAVDPESQATNVPGVFAGGDLTSGRGTVVQAIADGRRAAAAMNRYMMGVEAHDEDSQGEASTPLLGFNSDYLRRISTVAMPQLPISDRRIDTEDVLGLSSSDAEREANRCFNCGCVAASPSDIAPALIALDARIKTTKRTVAAEEFFAAAPINSTILGADELVTEVEIPGPKPATKQVFLKYRLRHSIDFPIVAVAVVISKEADKVDNARIVLGAAAPTPLRMREAEEFLKGKKIGKEVAQGAAAIAVKAAIPLAKNGYKVQVTKALLERAVLAAG